MVAMPSHKRDFEPHVYTDTAGRILQISALGAKLLNVPARGGHGRQLTYFIVREREHLLRLVEVASRGHEVVTETRFRPLGLASQAVTLQIHRVLGGSAVELAWNFELTGTRPPAAGRQS
jgi:hypothetical protein